MGVLSAIETACWDIVGKALGQSIYNLLGGKIPKFLPLPYSGKTAISFPWYSPEKVDGLVKSPTLEF